MEKFYLPLLLLLLSSCKNDSRNIVVYNTKQFVLVDTSFKADEYLGYNEHEYSYPIYYIGKMHDTISIGKSYCRFRTKWVNHMTDITTKKFTPKNISVCVANEIKTTITHEYINQQGEIIDDSSKHYAAILLLIKNKSDTALWLGRSFSLTFLNREIKDKNGHWIRPDSAIDKAAICGHNQPRIILKTGEILLAKVRRYKGHFVTDCRFAFGYDNHIVYSNVFKDSVDDRMFTR